MAKISFLGKEETRGYQWPASKLTGYEMEILAEWRERTGTPISHLLQQTVLKCQEMIVKGGPYEKKKYQ